MAKRAPLDRSALVRYAKTGKIFFNCFFLRFGKRAPLDRSALVR